MASVDVAELVALARRLADGATNIVVAGLDGDLQIDTKSSAVDLVTVMDRTSERYIVEGIRACRPHDGFLGEEGSDEPGTSGVRWLIDPIDGTTNYVYGQPAFAVSIAAQLDGDTIVGVVNDCLMHDQYVASRGNGASRNGRPISVSDRAELATSLVATGFSYSPERRGRQGEVVAKLLPHIRDIRRRGSAALDLCFVACGRVDAYFELGLGPWDMAAGELIAREAGARTADLAGGPPGFTVVAATPAIFEPLLTRLRDFGADAV
jgi:myo-inositol-1(or 4)-monophosphatase